MKNKIKLSGIIRGIAIITFLAVIGFSMAGCEDLLLDTTCQDCGGSGICKYCSGEGENFVPGLFVDFVVTDKNLSNVYGTIDTWLTCSNCSGSGKCLTCKGKGKVHAETLGDGKFHL